MTAPLSMDLRERIAAAHEVRDGTNEEIATRFGVSLTTVERLGRKIREGVGLVPGKPTGRPKLLKKKHHDWIAKQLRRDPYMTSYELTARLKKRFRRMGIHRSTVLRAMHELGFTFKKNSVRSTA